MSVARGEGANEAEVWHAPPRLMARLLATVALLALLDCRPRADEAAAADAGPPPPASAPAPAASALAPLGGEWLVRLSLPGFGDAVVSVPLGATSPRLVVVALHGRNDRPEWACGEWRGVTEGKAFVLCPHGVPVDAPPGRGLAFGDAAATRREIDAGLAALRARFGPWIAEGPRVLAGFSLGAILGVPIVAEDAARCPVAVLGEGGQAQWTPARAASFARGGGRRVLFVCSTGACEQETAAARRILEREGVATRLVSAGHVGHLVDDRVVAVARAAWPWVTEGLPTTKGP